jgi:hypothetical protein
MKIRTALAILITVYSALTDSKSITSKFSESKEVR